MAQRHSGGKILKIILSTSLVAWAAVIGLRAFLEIIYFDFPRNPDPSTARIVPYVVKNVVVYITEGQNDLLHWLRYGFYVFGVLILISFLLNLNWPWTPRR